MLYFTVMRHLIVLLSCLFFTFISMAEDFYRGPLPKISLLKHNQKQAQDILHLIYSHHLSPKRKAILKGLIWMIRVTDSLSAFKSIFQEYLTVLGELHHTNNKAQRKIVGQLLTNAIKRLRPYLKELHENDLEDTLNYIYIAPNVLEIDPKNTWMGEFFNHYFSKNWIKVYNRNFMKALKKKNYDRLTDFMSESAMLDLLFKLDKNHTFVISKNPYHLFHRYMQTLPWDLKPYDPDYDDQNYCMTHVVLSLNHYGRNLLSLPSSWRDKIIRYHWNHYHYIRYDEGDLDLLAEFLYDLKVLGADQDSRYKEGIRYILSAQHPDGSWGNEKDFTSDDLYDAFHPTWTALSTLNMDLGTEFTE